MTITSFNYLAFIVIGACLYYILPKRWQWIELLLLSLIFYFLTAIPYTILFLLISATIAYLSGIFISKKKEKTENSAILVTAAAIAINVILWFLLKGSNLWQSAYRLLAKLFPLSGDGFSLPFMAALGMGYYTLQVISYILDCYWGIIQPQKNPFKLFLFVSFFPQLTTGPISRYSQLTSLYEEHHFSYENVTRGSQRILYGFMKKLILAERIGTIVNAVWDELTTYTGFWVWIVLLLYPIQMYADFSGGMDIVLGTAEIFGIHMPENFNSPFSARTVQEFWQRWHITLGTWAKNYIMYPFLKWKRIVKFGRFTKRKFGKRIGKIIPTAIGMFVVWMVIGIWHGGVKHIIGVSLWYWGLLVLSQLLDPVFKRVTRFLKISTGNFSWHFFQSTRTYFLFSFGSVFFRADSIRDALGFIKRLFLMFFHDQVNPWIFFDGSILNMGVSYLDINIILIMLFIVVVTDVLHEKYGSARTWISQQNLVFRWGVWLVFFLFVLIYGKYGPGYDAAEFLYQGF